MQRQYTYWPSSDDVALVQQDRRSRSLASSPTQSAIESSWLERTGFIPTEPTTGAKERSEGTEEHAPSA